MVRRLARAARHRVRTARLEPRALRRELVDLVARECADRPEARVVVVGEHRRALVRALRRRGPGWQVSATPADPARRHVELALLPHADVVLAGADPAGDRLGEFRAAFFHTRPGGAFVVPRGADELGAARGALGEHLAEGWATEPGPLRAGRVRKVWQNHRLAIRMHVTGEALGAHLVLRHDLPDVVVKLDEPRGNAWIEASAARHGTPHRVLSVLPAEQPPSAAVITEVPEPRRPPMGRPIKLADIALREYRDVVVDVEQLVVTGRVVLPDTYRHNQAPTLTNFGVIDLPGPFGILQRPLPPAEDLPLLEGTYLHLDNEIRGHFGHTTTEVLSRMWSWPAALEVDPDVRVLMTAARGRPEIAEWEYDFYEACGIPRERIVKIDGPARVERLLSGTPMFSNPEYVHPRILETWDRLGDVLAARAEPRDDRPSRIFIARRIRKRACLNAEEVEEIFAARGFAIVYPEDYPLGEQVAMFRAADVVAGYAGSGMFHIAFVQHPQHVIQIGSDAYTPRNEVLMAALRGHRIDAVVSRASASTVQAEFAVDLDREGPHLHALLDRLPPA